MVTKVTDSESFKKAMEEHRAVLFYFGTQSCSVGEALEPKLRDLISQNYPMLYYCWVDMHAVPLVCAMNQVFVEPTLLMFVDSKESLRRSRHVSIAEIDTALERIYSLVLES